MSYKALLFCPNEKTARVVTQVLTELDFRVDPCNEPFAAVKKMMAEHFDAIVVDCENEQNAALLFKSAHNSGANQAALAVAVVEGQAGVAQAFRIGANLVLTKPINVEQSKGTLRVARGLLKKTEGTKATTSFPAAAPPTPATPPISARSSTPITAAPKWPSTPEMSAPNPKMTSLPSQQAATSPPQPPAISAPSPTASVFELEEEPEVKPEPTEAALLESMPDPQAGIKHTADSTPTPAAPKEYPWQRAKPMAEPMATALRRAAEAAGKVQADASTTANVLTSSATTGVQASSAKIADPESSYSHSVSAGTGTGAAAAPAKEVSHAIDDVEIEESQPPAPLFSSMADAEFDEASEGGKKKIMIAAGVLIALAASGYIGWTKMHSATAETPIVRRPPAPIQSPVQTPAVPQPTPSAVVTPSTPSEPSAPDAAARPAGSATSETPVEGPDITLSTTEKAPSKSTKPASVPATPKKTATPPTLQGQQPILVKAEAPKQALNPAPPEPTVAAPDPGAMVASNTNDQAISGIVSAPPANAPQAAPQALRVSQGIAQGLLVKSVQPVYPAQAKQMHMQGAVELLADISKDGDITSVKVLSGDSILAHAALDAVKQWKYRPYLLNGQPVGIQTQITVHFRLP